MVQNQDLCLWCCDWIGAGSLAPLTPLSVSLFLSRSLLLPLDEVSDRVRWPVSNSTVDQHPHAPNHLSSPPPFPPEEPGCRLAGVPTHLQTRPPDLASPLIPFHPSRSPSLSPHTYTQLYTYSPHSLFPCVGTEGRGQAARQAGGLVCGTVLISTGIWRRKPRYLQAPSSKPLISLPLPLPLPVCLWRLLPSCRLRRQVCEGCRCQLSFSWTAANLSPYLPSVVISSFIPISRSLFTHLPQFIC